MLLSTAEDLAKFVFELQRETDRGLPLVAAALIDDRLTETLRSFFREVRSTARLLDDGNAPLGTFSARADICHALGLIDDYEHSEIALIRKVRNEFAHTKHGMSFQSPRVKGLCTNLQSHLPDGGDYPISKPRFRFTNAVVAIALRLYHRPDWVARERRQAKLSVDADASQWRRIDTDPPPPGMPVMAIGKKESGRS